MIQYIYKLITNKEILKLRTKKVKKLEDIHSLKEYLSLKLNKISI